MITMEIQKDHRYLRCTKRVGPCAERYLREEVCTEQFNQRFETYVVDKEIPMMLLEIVEQDRVSERERRLSYVAGINAQLKAASERTDQLLNLLLKDLK